MIRLQDVSKRYPNGFLALNNINLQLAPGELVFLTGHSGAGKSTLLKLIAAIETTRLGQIFVGKFHLKSQISMMLSFFRKPIPPSL